MPSVTELAEAGLERTQVSGSSERTCSASIMTAAVWTTCARRRNVAEKSTAGQVHTKYGGGVVVGPEQGQVCSLKRQLLGLALEDEGGQVGTQNKRSARVLRRKNLRQVFGRG